MRDTSLSLFLFISLSFFAPTIFSIFLRSVDLSHPLLLFRSISTYQFTVIARYYEASWNCYYVPITLFLPNLFQDARPDTRFRSCPKIFLRKRGNVYPARMIMFSGLLISTIYHKGTIEKLVQFKRDKNSNFNKNATQRFNFVFTRVMLLNVKEKLFGCCFHSFDAREM